MQSRVRIIGAVFVVLGLSGCSMKSPALPGVAAPAIPTILTIDAASLINTGKTLDDHVMTWATGENCSTLAATKGEPYCKAWPQPAPTMPRTTYCYKSLAAVTCYDRPFPADQSRYLGARVDKVPILEDGVQ